jgi:Uma2 family endonuclease
MTATQQKKYTYQDYLTWDDGKRWELINGVPYCMSPTPVKSHQDVVLSLGSYLKNKLKDKKCKAYIAPRDVVLSEDDVVQPDVLVVCDPKKDKEACIQGAPELIFEVLSPSTERKDRWDKKLLYEKYGVKEYVILSPKGLYAELYRLQENGKFDRGESFGKEEILILQTLENLEIPLTSIFDFDEPQ